MRPLLLLDVDGVVHDRHAMEFIRQSPDPAEAAADLDVSIIQSHGRTLAMPNYMPGLVAALVERCEVWWCSTWRSRANDTPIDRKRNDDESVDHRNPPRSAEVHAAKDAAAISIRCSRLAPYLPSRPMKPNIRIHRHDDTSTVFVSHS